MLHALAIAAADPAPPVVKQVLDALQPVAEALFRGTGLGAEHFDDAVAAAAAAMRNPVSEELSIGAVWALQSVAKRLADAPAEVSLSPRYIHGCRNVNRAFHLGILFSKHAQRIYGVRCLAESLAWCPPLKVCVHCWARICGRQLYLRRYVHLFVSAVRGC